MRKMILILTLSLCASHVQAQGYPSGCETDRSNNTAAGAVIGGVAGALLGNAVSGRHKAPGTIIGGITGAVAGGAIGGSSNPCPQGYHYREEPVYHERDFWYGAPPTVYERIAFLRHRVEVLDNEGWLSPRESRSLFHRLAEIQRRNAYIRDQNDGYLPREASYHLNAELNDVARHLRWEEYRAQHG